MMYKYVRHIGTPLIPPPSGGIFSFTSDRLSAFSLRQPPPTYPQPPPTTLPRPPKPPRSSRIRHTHELTLEAAFQNALNPDAAAVVGGDGDQRP